MRSSPHTAAATSRQPIGLTRRSVLVGAGTVALAALRPPALALAAASGPDVADPAVATAWFDLAQRLVRDTPGYSPPIAARAFGYAGVALYEAIAPGSRQHRSLHGALPGLGQLPHPTHLHWPAVANASLATTFRALFATSPDFAAIGMHESSLADQFGRDATPDVLRRSSEHGTTVGEAIIDWSRADGSRRGDSRNLPAGHTPTTGPGMWVPTPPRYQQALLPHWGDNRCLAITDAAAFAAGDHTPFSEDPSSAFFGEALEVYDAVNGLTAEHQAIAEFWADDPGKTSTPPGHSIAVATQVLRFENASLMTAAETYAKVGLAVSDAFVACWNTKYRDNLLRPVTYIQRLIDPGWLPPVNTPPFPEFTSGHSVQSAAAFTVLADLFGSAYAFDDHTHDERGLAPRHFESFAAAAEQAAVSRLYGGIHFRPAIEVGLEQGRSVGEAVNALPFRRD
jgi:hypothetical protein